VLRELSIAIENSAYANSGEIPSNWQQLKPFLRKEFVEAHRSPGLEKQYVFLKDTLRLPRLNEAGLPAGRIILIAKSPTPKKAGSAEHGRGVIYRADSDGFLRPGWVPEREVQTYLAEASELLPAKRVDLTLEISNPAATLIAGEPLCVSVRAGSSQQAVPDFAEFIFEAVGPDTKIHVEVMDSNLLEKGTGRPYFDFKEAPQNGLTCTFHAVLVLSEINQEKPTVVRLLTERVDDYQIKIKERRSGSGSPPVQFRVVPGTKEDQKATALFASGAGVFLGQTDGMSVYEDLLGRHPNSRYAAYASFFVGRAKLEKLEASGKGRKNAAEIAALEMYFDKTLTLGFPSIFELKALLYKARCLTAAGKVEARRKVLSELAAKYGVVAGVSGLE
jgi:hypothetical protein